MSKRKTKPQRMNALPNIDPKLDTVAQRSLAEAYRLQKETEHTEADNKGKLIETSGKVLLKAITAGIVLIPLYYGGKQLEITLLKADIEGWPELITLLISLSPWWLWLAVGLIVVVLPIAFWFHKRICDRKISTLSARNELLEKMLDPLRTSSQLSPNGSTNRRDR